MTDDSRMVCVVSEFERMKPQTTETLRVELPTDAEGDRNQLGVSAHGCRSQTVRRRNLRRSIHVEIAHFGEEFHAAVAVDASQAMSKSAADVPAALIAREVSNDRVFVGNTAIKVSAVFRRFRVGKVCNFAIEAAAAGDI